MLKRFFLIVAMTFLLTGCSSKNKESYESQPADNAFILKTNISDEGEYEPEDLYVKYEGKEIQKAISDGMPMYKYMNGKESVLVQNQSNELIKVDKNGNEEIIANNMDEYMGDVKVSADGEVIVFTNNDWNLYIKRGDEEKIKIDDNVEYFYISDDAEYVYYSDGDDNFYVYDGTKSEKIGYGIYNHEISNNGKNVAFVEGGDRFYLKLGDKKEIDEIISSGVVRQYKVYDDGSVSYIKVQEHADEFGELHIYKDGNKEMIARVVEKYFKKHDIVYYLDGNKNLYERNIKEDEPVRLLSNVCELNETRDGIVAIDKSGNVHIKNNKSELVKIGKTDDVEDEVYLGMMEIVNGNDVVYDGPNNSLYINNKKIADNVLSYACNSQNVAYVTDERKIYTYNTKNDSSKLEIDDLTGYTTVYFEDKHLYYNKLEISDLVGFWQISKGEESDTQDFIIEFRGKDILVQYHQNGDRYSNVFEILGSYFNYISLETDDGSFIEISKDENEQTKLDFDGTEYLCTRVDKEKADKIIKLGMKNYKALNSDEEIDTQVGESIDEYEYESIDYLLQDYIYDYVYAVNENDFERIVPYLVYDGPLYKEHSKNVTGFYEKGISEKLYSSQITEIKKNSSGDFEVKTLDKIGIIKNGEEEIKDFEPVYLIKEIDGQYLIYEML